MDILLIILLIILNGMFAMSEIALISSRKTRLQHWADEGRSGAARALKMANEPSHFLSTVQVGITLIGVLNGAIGESAIADKLAAYFARIPELAPYSHHLSVALMVLIITYFSLIIGELVPKRLAMRNPEPIASFFAGPMRVLSIVAFPLVKLLSVSTELVLKLFGRTKGKEPSITEEEIQCNCSLKSKSRSRLFSKTNMPKLTKWRKLRKSTIRIKSFSLTQVGSNLLRRKTVVEDFSNTHISKEK